ncbi:MAG: hypothetical protein ACI30R_03345, partial [Sodaliphilus sp.]
AFKQKITFRFAHYFCECATNSHTSTIYAKKLMIFCGKWSCSLLFFLYLQGHALGVENLDEN